MSPQPKNAPPKGRVPLTMSPTLREAVRKLRPLIGARSEAAVIRIAVGALCRGNGLDVPGSEEHPDPDDQPEAMPEAAKEKEAKRAASKPRTK